MSAPVVPDSLAHSTPRTRPEDILGAFQGAIAPVRVGLAYRIALVLTTLAMIALPVAYLAIIGVVAWGVLWHASANADMLDHGPGLFRLLLYGTPMAVGGLLVLFMLKPFFAGRPAQTTPRGLKKEDEPILFAYVERVCTAVGAPMPSEIRVDCEVNASASFRRGVGSFLSHDLVLTVGLPLIAGFNARQLTGVLGHEFGHFAQGTGMRLTYVIRSINGWLARVAHERDEWDIQLAETAANTDIRLGIVLHIARALIWATRRILWALTMIAHTLSCFLLRQMEFDADRYEARLVGSDVFEQTARRLPLLAVAARGARSDLSNAWSEEKLSDDFPALVMANLEELGPEIDALVRKHVDEAKTGFFDTHPCDRERILSAHAEAAQGAFHLDAPATHLFSDFARLCEEFTLSYYTTLLEQPISSDQLVPAAQIIAEQRALQEGQRALERLFQGGVTPLRPFWPSLEPPAEATASDGGALRDAIEGHRAKSREIAAQVRQHYRVLDEADDRFLDTLRADTLLRAGFSFSADNFGLPSVTQGAVADARISAETAGEAARQQLVDLDGPGAARLSMGLRVLRDPDLGADVDDAENTRGELERLRPILAALQEIWPDMDRLRDLQARAAVLIRNIQGNESDPGLGEELTRLAESSQAPLQHIRATLGGLAYPFAHRREDMPLDEFAVPNPPKRDDVGQLLASGHHALEQLSPLYLRCMGRVALAVEAAEAGLGFAPLSEEPEDTPELEAVGT